MAGALTQENVRVAGSGAVWIADAAGATMPTDPTTDPTGFISLGYVTTDGVTFTLSRESTDLNAWQGDKIRVLVTAEPMTVEFALMETSPDVLIAALGGGTIDTATGIYTISPPAKGTNNERALVIDFNDGDDIHYRYCIPKAQIEGDVSWQLQRADSLNYPLTFGVLDGDPKYQIVTDDPVFATAPELTLAEPTQMPASEPVGAGAY